MDKIELVAEFAYLERYGSDRLRRMHIAANETDGLYPFPSEDIQYFRERKWLQPAATKTAQLNRGARNRLKQDIYDLLKKVVLVQGAQVRLINPLMESDPAYLRVQQELERWGALDRNVLVSIKTYDQH